MNRRAKIVLAAAAVTVAGLATVGSITASAHLGLAGNGEYSASLAQKLGVSQDKVNEALDSMRAEHQAQMLARYETRLSELVGEGKITEAQKQLILDKHKELTAKREQERQELQSWAEVNGVDLQYLMGHGHGMGHGMMH